MKAWGGRKAISLREKGAVEPTIITASLASKLEKQGLLLSDYLKQIFDQSGVKGRYDIRVDVNYYNENELDQVKRNAEKTIGEAKRTKNDMFYRSMAMAKRENKIDLDQVKAILNQTFAQDGLNFDDLKDVLFVGDGTLLLFPNKYIEVRPSGTDAKTKAYGAGDNKAECLKYATILGNYSGERTPLHLTAIEEAYYNNVIDHSLKTYYQWSGEGAPPSTFNIPHYASSLAPLAMASK